MEELLFDSIESAAGCINGDLKKMVFGQFLKSINRNSPIQDSVSDFAFAAVFVATAFHGSIKDERKTLCEQITKEVIVMSELVKALNMFWKREIIFDKVYITGLYHLLHLLINSWQYTCLFKKCLLEDGCLASIVASVKEHFSDTDVCSLEKESLEYKLLCCCLEIICLCIDDHLTHMKCVQMGLFELSEKFANSSHLTVRLISKAIIGHLTDKYPNDIASLTDEEMAALLAMFKNESHDPLYISDFTIASMLKGFTNNKANTEQFQNHNFTCLLEQKWNSSSIDVIITQLNSSLLDTDTTSTVEKSQMSSHDTENELPYLISVLMEYFVKHTVPLDSPKNSRQLTVGEFDNIAASLQLTETLLSGCDNQMQKEIQNVITSIPNVAKASSVLIEHLHDDGATETFRLCAFKSLLFMMMQLTDCSPQMCRELGMSGFIALLMGYLENLTSQLFIDEDEGLILMLLTIILNCANEPSNYPVFEASHIPDTIIKFTHHPSLEVAILGKMILSFLLPILTNEQYFVLQLTQDESEYLVTELSKSVASSDLKADGHSAIEVLTFLLNFTKQITTVSLQENDGQPERKESNFRINFKQRIKVFTNNIQVLTNLGIVKSLESLMAMGAAVDSVIIEKSLHLLWSLIHNETVMKLLSPSVSAMLANIHFEVSASAKSLILCIQWLLGCVKKSDVSVAFKYAQACYAYGNYQECADVCRSIKKQIRDEHLEFDPIDLELLHGKALYYCYQPDLRYLIKSDDDITPEELSLVSDEYFKKIKNSIALLGKCLDAKCIDEEGSRFLDFALNSCAADLNALNQCKRCLLCRRGGQKLKRSHLWPNSVLKSIYKFEYEGEIRPFLFGHQSSRPKTARECTIFMFCQTCEELLSQNGEEQFAKLFDSIQKDPCSTQLTYGKWLYNFAVGMIFRELAMAFIPYFPNCQEVYNVYLLCRKHLFTLTAKIEAKIIPSFSKLCAFQFEKMCSGAIGDLHIYMIRCRPELALSDDPMVQYFSECSHCAGSVATCRLEDSKLDLSGCVHFLEIYCNGIHFLLKFQASESCTIPEKFLINPCLHQDQCVLPPEDLSAIPDGVWFVIHHLGTTVFDSRMHTYQNMSEKTLQLVTSSASSHHDEQLSHKSKSLEIFKYSTDIASESKPLMNLPWLHCFSFLPKDYAVKKDVQLPEGHVVVTHFTAQVDELLMTYLLCMSGKSSYIIIVHCDRKTDQQIIDGVYISNDEEPKVIGFLLENRPGMENLPRPFTLDELQMIINEQLPLWLLSKGIKSLPQLVHLVESRSSLSSTRSVPSLDLRCPYGCWYCKNRCQCCMWLIAQEEGKFVQLQPDKFLYFCGEKCRQLMYPDPGAPPTISATYHKMKPGEEIGLAKLQILKSIVPEGKKQSKVEFIELCIKTSPDVMENVPVGKPYVLWLIRSTDQQQFLDFILSDACELLQCIWHSKFSQLSISLQDEAIKGQLNKLLKNVFQIVLNQIGFPDLKSFVMSYKSSVLEQSST